MNRHDEFDPELPRNSIPAMVKAFVQFELRTSLGRLLDVLGMPGFIQAGHYKSMFGPEVIVRRGAFSTVVCVNGLQISFSRLTGRLIEVGYDPGVDYKLAGITHPIDVPRPPPGDNSSNEQ